MPRPASLAKDRLAIWCGWVLIVAAALIPVLGYIAPLGFPMLLALVGLLCLPAVRMSDQDRPSALILFAALIWAAVSTTWSPYQPSKPGNSTILKLALQLPLYWSAISAARRADPRVLRWLALQVLAWGCAATFGLVLLEETFTRAALYKALHVYYEPIRPDLAESNVGHSTQVLGLIWPLAAVGASRVARPWLALAMFAGTGAAALAFGYDSSTLGLVLAPLTALIVWRWPRGAPLLMAAAASALFLGAPLAVWAVRHFFDYAAIQNAMPEDRFHKRMGYWSHYAGLDRAAPGAGLGPRRQPQFWARHRPAPAQQSPADLAGAGADRGGGRRGLLGPSAGPSIAADPQPPYGRDGGVRKRLPAVRRQLRRLAGVGGWRFGALVPVISVMK